MKYKVCNLERDMKLGTRLIKRGESVSVSQQDYQFLAQVYGMAVKGEKELVVRVTEPAKIQEDKPVLAKEKKRKHKKS